MMTVCSCCDFSIIIPAYDEEQWLAPTLCAVRQAMSGVDLAGEVIVVDNNSKDGTARVARDHGARVVLESINQISRARNRGARTATGQYLIFLDADTVLSEQLLRTALDKLTNGACCGGGALVAFDRSVPALERVGLALWNFVSLKLQLAAGCFIYCTRQGFDATGGFSQKVYAGDEVWFSRRLRSWGRSKRMDFRVITDPAVVTSSRKIDWSSSAQATVRVLPLLLFPFGMRFRRLCSYWYARPLKKE